MRSIIAAVVVGAVLAPVLVGGAQAGTEPGLSPSAMEPGVSVDVTITRHNETTVAYRYRFTGVDDARSYRVRLYTGTVVDRSGFESVAPRVLESTGEREATITAYQRAGERSDDRCLCIATRDWVVVQPLRMDVTVETEQRSRRLHLTEWFGGPTVDADIRVPEGEYTTGLVYLGPTELVDATSPDGTSIRVLGPDDSEQLDAERVLGTLERAGRTLDLTAGSDRPVTVGVVPHTDGTLESAGARGLEARGVTWSHGYAVVDGSTGPSTWLHEYTHTQERFATAEPMDWYTEATATYFGTLLSYRLDGRSDESVFDRYRSEPAQDTVLSMPSSWGSRYVPYERGARVVAYLDWQIRTATDGNRTFADVYRRTNRDTVLEVSDLRTAVAAVVGDRSLDPVITRYVTTDASLGTDWGPPVQPSRSSESSTVTTVSDESQSRASPITSPSSVSPPSPSTDRSPLVRGSIAVVGFAVGLGVALYRFIL